MASDPGDPGRGWTTASDLAEYAYCPRAHWYRHHARNVPLDRTDAMAIGRGRSYHARRAAELSAHARWGYGPVLLVVLVGILLVIASVAGWIP
ncbi:MAG: hypothetical protein L3J93_01630 [Thermoplasmata archaeon]|nr:hypothetical protein [Thermoplasmata archaeon]